ncbi:hypothetical protein CC1G_08677 [Coprinopsis cinerea okayama7|uniref:SHSP domain-containing protein n=1 Tax=Coprinopsis cinerea (strain Okayama-7 / 130 / ATCC MYA-4618 / FGSC 9003) TaxID=240176 RepID=A8NZF2_COPC7|nr:hypothetical protein CC1G_08677 [Coprinopsis cinerea okayama7\|eukprot:XP_001837664.1 hypothetical protein CC1G_08677 [Coprinopsis cinerea okayama7\
MSSKTTLPSGSTFDSSLDMTRSPAFQRAVLRAAQYKCLQALKAGKIRLVQEPNPNIPTRFTPRMDLVDDTSANKLTAIFELPGVKTSDISLQIREGNLIVTGERRAPQTIQSALASQKTLPRNPVTAADDVAAGDESESTSSHVAIQELRFGSFYRSLPVPAGIKESDVTAALQDGMLTVTWPKIPGRLQNTMAVNNIAPNTSAIAAQ